MKCRIALVAALLPLAWVAEAGMVTRRWGRPPTAAPSAPKRAKPPTGYIVSVAQPPTVDGRLDDACWAKAFPLRLGWTLDGSNPAPQPTEVRVVLSGKSLFLAIRCREPFMGKLVGTRRGHDADFWTDDSVEIFVSPPGAPYRHLAITAFGSTYDASVKDRSWRSAMRAAVARGKGEWTAELAIPLADITGGPTPKRLRANFTRNRHTTGRWEEMAWSPTYSGDSHVPARFGTLVFGAPPPEHARPKAPKPATPEMRILPCRGGEAIVWFDLSAIRGKKVYRADLLVFRTATLTGANDEAMTDIEIYPLFHRPSAPPKPETKPLEPRPPWFDRFDATAVVQAWAAGKPNGGFFVKTLPLWNPEATCLEVAYEGQPREVPPQATGLEVFHRSGQTFITWREIEDPVGRDQITWGELKTIIESLDRNREVRYLVYRHTEPITASNIHQATLLARVRPLSCWNINGRNIDCPVDRFIATSDYLPTGHWNPFRDATVDGRFGRDCPIDRLAIRPGEPLPRATGLYVHTVAAPGKAYYAVVTCIDGVENTRDFSPANSLTRPVRERPGEPEPVFQRELPKMPFFNYRERRLHFVRWVGPPYANVPCQYYNWSVGVPEPLGRGVPLELSLHRDGHSYWRTQYRLERDSVVVSPHDFPLQTFWCGYHENYGTLRSFRRGRIQPYTERRLLSFIRWACRKWPIDRNRIIATGCRGGGSGSGALHLGMRHPEVFALVVAGHPLVHYANAARRTDRAGRPLALAMQAVWGKPQWKLPAEDGTNFWDHHDLIRLAERLPVDKLPLLAITSRNSDPDCRRFYEVLLRRHAPVMAYFWWGGTRYLPVSRTGTFPNVIRLDVARNKPLLAFSSEEALRIVGEGRMGAFNLEFRWREVLDAPDRFEATIQCTRWREGRSRGPADIAIIRPQRFRIERGRRYAWQAVGPDRKPLQRGTVQSDDQDLLVLPGINVAEAGIRIVVLPESRR